jgi:acetate kinase
MNPHILVINSGSSSIKYRLLDPVSRLPRAWGVVERVGQAGGSYRHSSAARSVTVEEDVPDHETGLARVLDLFRSHGPELDSGQLAAVAHRVVQGGAVFSGPAVIDEDVETQIAQLSTLAPLHNPANLAGIRAARQAFPDVPHVAVFDTSFHQTLPPAASTYAIDRRVAERAGIRRYGFHGTSHAYVSRRTAELMGRSPSGVNVIVLHLGNGASATAVADGRSVETSMGFTPLEGLVMGTRAGDVDPAVLLHLLRTENLDVRQVDELLNRRSGMLGLCGMSDMRDIHEAALMGDDDARTALDVYCHRIKGYVGAYTAQLGRLDAVVFTAGVGENDDLVRWHALAGLAHLGIEIDPARNHDTRGVEGLISSDASPVQVWVVPTNEELEIATQALTTLGSLTPQIAVTP